MLYLLLTFPVLLVGLNVYASRLSLRSPLNDRWQRNAQLLLIWLVPFVGSLLTIHVLGEHFRSSWFGRGHAEMEPEQAWLLAGHGGGGNDCSPGDSDCGE
jgi:hypothetical protein